MMDSIVKVILMCFLILVIIQDVRSYTISLYHLIGLMLCSLCLDGFSLWSGLLGNSALLTLLLYIHYISKHKISDAIGSGDILLLILIFFVTPFAHISTLLLLSGISGCLFYYIFKKHYVPLGAGVAFAYSIIIFLL